MHRLLSARGVRAHVMRRWSWAAPLLLAAAWTVTSCATDPGESPELWPSSRLVDLIPRDRLPRHLRGRVAEVGDVRRPTFYVVKAVSRQLRACPEAKANCFFTDLRPPGRAPSALVRIPRAMPSSDRKRQTSYAWETIGRIGRRIRTNAEGAVAVWEMPSLERNDVTTPPVEILPGSELRFATATQPVAWNVATAPVDFVVLARRSGGDRGNPIELFRTRMDPTAVAADRAWRDHRIPLDRLAGETVRMEFQVRKADPDDPRFQLPLWGDPAIWSPLPEGDRPPWIVLVSVDTLRAQSMSTFGYEIETTPSFSKLAEQGTLLENAYTTFINTAAHHSMHTGNYHTRWRIPAESTTLAERLGSYGYPAAAFTENAMLIAAMGMERGFGLYAENKQVTLGDAKTTFAQALSWAQANRRSPFFLFVHTYAVHAPYDPEPPYDSALVEEFERAGVEGDLRLYEQEVRELDDDLARFVRGLAATLPPERLLLIVTADHGEEFLEHGERYHMQPYDEVLHVPLLFLWPGHVAAGRRVGIPVSLTDIVPSVLDLLGLPVPGDVDGVSLAPLLRSPAGSIDRQIVFANGGFGEGGPRLVARSLDHKCIKRSSVGPECFDLRADPFERNALPVDAAPEFGTLLEALADHEALVASRRPGGPAAMSPNQAPPTDDPERKRKLEALGYVE